MKITSKLPGLRLALLIAVKAFPASANTLPAYTLTYDNLVAGANALAFSMPKFDPALGSLQSVDIACNFSGIIGGIATGVSQSSSMFGTITHHMFFDFTDTSDMVGIAEPTLELTEVIPTGAANSTISFGPEYQDCSFSFSVGAGDPRFAAWSNGPGDFSGSLSVFFTNTTQNAWGLQFFPGNDTGVYCGSLSVAYSYEPVPEPASLTLAAMGLLVVVGAKLKLRRAAQFNNRPPAVGGR